MDGFDHNSCKVLAATNRLDVIDPALLRPGRFGTILYVGVPNAEAKFENLKALTRKGLPPLDSNLDLKKLANDKRLNYFTGADLKGLLELAHSIATNELKERFKRLNQDELRITVSHIEKALKEKEASVNPKQLAKYQKFVRQIDQDLEAI